MHRAIRATTSGVTDEQLFRLFLFVLPAWFLLLLAPRGRGTMKIVTVTAGLYSAMYVGLMARALAAEDDSSIADCLTYEGVVRALTKRSVVLPAWCHFVVFDLWTARWEVMDAQGRGVPQVLMALPVLLTMMAGPAGLLVYLAAIRPCFHRRPNSGVSKDD